MNIYKSKVINQEFEVTNTTDSWEEFTGTVAYRIPDKVMALVNLKTKPKGYEYDFVVNI